MNSQKKYFGVTIAFFMGSGAGWWYGAGDQIRVEEMDWLLEEVVVTAQKREQRLIDVPISIVAMSAAEIEGAWHK